MAVTAADTLDAGVTVDLDFRNDHGVFHDRLFGTPADLNRRIDHAFISAFCVSITVIVSKSHADQANCK